MAKILKFQSPQQPRRINWFAIALVALPLGAFSAVLLAPAMGGGPDQANAAPMLLAEPADTESANFPICSRARRVTCVVDGDTIWYRGAKIRIADIDTPEVRNAGCAREARLGHKATQRLQSLLNAGGFTLAANPDGRDQDRFGRKLRVVTRDGASLGDVLVREGLAERWGGSRIAWCG